MDDNSFNNYETTEFKMSSSQDYHSKTNISSNQLDKKEKLSKNGLYYHTSRGTKSFGITTMLLIIFVLAFGIGIGLCAQDRYPFISLICYIGSLVIVFCGILGGKRPKD